MKLKLIALLLLPILAFAQWEMDFDEDFAATSSAWSPLKLGIKLAGWFDASDVTTVTTNASGNITLWADKSANGRDASPLSGDVYYTASQYATFNGGILSVAAFTASNACVIAVLQNIATNRINYFLGNRDYGFYSGGSYYGYTGYGVRDNDGLTTRSATTHNTALNVVFINKSGVFLNAAALEMTTTGSIGVLTMDRIGGRDTGTLNAQSRIHELLILDGLVTDAERISAQTYLKNKWGTP